MNVSLARDLEKFVTEKVESGLYHAAREVVRDASACILNPERTGTEVS